MEKLYDYEYVILRDWCNKYNQQKIADVIWFSRVIVNSVLNWKQKMSRLMKYAIRELTEKDVDYQIILRKIIEYISNDKEKIDDILYSLPEDIKKYFNL